MTLQLTRLNPVSELGALEIDRLNRMFHAAFSGEAAGGAWVPTDVYETASHDLVITADLPAMKKDDIKVTFENSVLTIEGERKMSADVPVDAYHRLERSYGTFRRSFTLPAYADASRVAASYQDGVLTITLPRREESRPRQIIVNG